MPADTELATKRTRKTTPSEYRLQEYRIGNASEPAGWFDVQPVATTFTDAAAAIKHVRETGREGKFRVIRVVREFSVKKETKTVMKIT